LKRKVVLYDFDKTVVDCESIFKLYKYALIHKKINLFTTILKFIYSFILSKIKRNFKIMKNEMVSVIKYFSEDELKAFVTEYLYPKYFFEEFYEEFNAHSDAIRVLCSASATNYLKYVAEIFPFDYIIGTDLDENFKILKENNKKNIKVKNIKEIFEKENIEIDYENSRGYSDSYKDDKYMLSLVEKKFLINSKVNKKGYKNLKWKRKNWGNTPAFLFIHFK